MATESILKNFIISDPKDVEIFANAVEESYQESLTRKEDKLVDAQFIKGQKAIEYIDKLMKNRYKRKNR